MCVSVGGGVLVHAPAKFAFIEISLSLIFLSVLPAVPVQIPPSSASRVSSGGGSDQITASCQCRV